MKKLVRSILVMMMALAMAFTAVLPGAGIVAQAAGKYNVTVKVDGSQINVKGYFKTGRSGKKVAMVPMRKVCKAAGITVKKNADGSYTLDTGDMHVDFSLKKDSYSFTTSIKGVSGATGPVSCGAAAVVKNGRIYIPANVFTPLYGNGDDIVKVSGRTVTITTIESTNVVNPITEYKTLAELETALGFKMMVPTAFAKKTVNTYASIDSDLGEIFYANGSDEILYRMSRGTEDNSGDYNTYKTSITAAIGGHTVTLKGNDSLFNLAVWNDGTYSYSISMGTNGVSQAELTADAASVQ